MAESAVFWIANGFDPADPTRTDKFSRSSLRAAVSYYHKLKEAGRQVYFPIIRSIVRDFSQRQVLHDVLWNEALRERVDSCDMEFTRVETTGSPTDGRAIAVWAREHPEAEICIFASTRSTAEFFEVLYPSVAYWIEGDDLDAYMFYPGEAKGSIVSNLVYVLLKVATKLASSTRFTFVAWYRFLNWVYNRRRLGFERTVH